MNVSEHVMGSMILGSSRGLTEFTHSVPPTVQFIHESASDFLLGDHGKLFLWEEPTVDSG